MPEPKVAPAPAPSPVNGAVKVKDGKKNGATTKPPAPQPPIAPAPPEPTVNPASAIPTIQPAPAPSPGIPTENVAAAFTTGTLAMQSGKNAEAIEMFEKVVRLDPYYADAWTNLAILYEKSGNLEKSKAAFRKARESIGR
jgi:predicted Zn-dependent protease